MIDWLQTALIVASLVLAVAVGVYVALNRATDDALVAACAVLEVALIGQLIAGIVQVSGTDREVDSVVFVGYLIGILLVLPAGVLWSLAEKGRGASAVLLVAALTVAFLELRLGQIWSGAL